MRVVVQVCNGAVCTQTDFIDLVICEEDEEERDENIQLVLENVLFFFFFFFFSFGEPNFFFLDP